VTGDGPPGPDPWAGHAVVLHVDMDAFFAAVEVLDDPTLAGLPLIVGGDGARGVVASASYEARAWGVHSAMPSVRARQLCPSAVFRPGRHHRYGEVSRIIHEVFGRFSPVIEPIGLDEAFLDVTGARRLFGPPEAVAAAVRRAVAEETRLSCSVGVAPSKMVAKLASEAAKPRATRAGRRDGPGIVVVAPGEELGFLHPRPIEALWGVGPATATRLAGLGVRTIGDLAALPVDVLAGAVGKAAGTHLHDLANARDARPVVADRPAKSVGHEETYQTDRHSHEELHVELIRMADMVAARVRQSGRPARTVQLKVRFADFTTITRARTVTGRLDTGPAIARVAARLLDEVDVGPGVRLLGVSVSGFADGDEGSEQLALELDLQGAGGAAGPGTDAEAAGAEPDPERWRAATGAIDAVRARFGDGAVGPATLVDGGVLHVGRGDNRWQPLGDGPGEGSGRVGSTGR